MKDVSYHNSLEFSRIDNTKNFSPENCKWMTHSEVMLNNVIPMDCVLKNLHGLPDIHQNI